MKKKLTTDFIYTFSALLLSNVVLQLVIYPLVNKYYGADTLGDIVYYTGLIYIISASVGNACSNQRLMSRKLFKTTNGDFNIIVLFASVLIAIVYMLVIYVTDSHHQFDFYYVLYGLTAVCIFFRYYSEVEFRLNLNFKGYLIYYIIVSAGYIFGFILFLLTDLWTLIFICGEGLAVLYVVIKGNIYKIQKPSDNIYKVSKLVVVLSISYILIFIVSQYFKFFLKWYFDSTAVTEYYVASFFGKSLDMVITPISTLIMSYLTKNENELSKKKFKKIVFSLFGIIFVLYFVFIIATPIYTYIFYNDLYNKVFSINFIVNLAQSISASASIISVLVLTKLGTKLHFVIQLTYAIIYVGLTSLLSVFLGVLGFAVGATIAFSYRFIITSFIGIKKI